MQTYACITNGKVVNAIAVNTFEDVKDFKSQFDYFIRIDQLAIIPGIDWDYDGIKFTDNRVFEETPYV